MYMFRRAAFTAVATVGENAMNMRETVNGMKAIA
jgi:hypothetical protein